MRMMPAATPATTGNVDDEVLVGAYAAALTNIKGQGQHKYQLNKQLNFENV
jgi:hypothetical protein